MAKHLDLMKILKNSFLSDLDLPRRFQEGIYAAYEAIYSLDIRGLCYIILFGSCANGNIKTSSDIDLLIVTDELLTDRNFRSYIREKVDEAANKLEVTIDIVFYTENTLFTEDSVFTRNIRKDGIILRKGDSENGNLLCSSSK